MTTAPNLPAQIVKLPSPTPCVTSLMSSDELARHRQRVSFEVEVILQGYWQSEMAPEIKAGVMADWADELQDWTIEQVRWGLREWRKENPRRKPNPGDIVGILKAQRGRAEAAKMAALPKPEEPPRETVSPEAVAEIMAGFSPRRIPEVKE